MRLAAHPRVRSCRVEPDDDDPDFDTLVALHYNEGSEGSEASASASSSASAKEAKGLAEARQASEKLEDCRYGRATTTRRHDVRTAVTS